MLGWSQAHEDLFPLLVGYLTAFPAIHYGILRKQNTSSPLPALTIKEKSHSALQTKPAALATAPPPGPGT